MTTLFVVGAWALLWLQQQPGDQSAAITFMLAGAVILVVAGVLWAVSRRGRGGR